jgi:hypothetical protein
MFLTLSSVSLYQNSTAMAQELMWEHQKRWALLLQCMNSTHKPCHYYISIAKKYIYKYIPAFFTETHI